MAENDKEKERKKDEEDLTKEAFFSDMGSIEEEIATEAIELVKHALSLVDTGFYDDAVEVIRQAIGLYDQINKLEEINALKKKVDEIYILKENSFRERELQTTSETELTREEELLTKNLEESYKEADSLIVKAIELVNIREFDGALDLYDDAIKILKSLKRSSEVEKINDLIEDCYNRKAEFLREQNIPSSEETTTREQESEGELSDLELKALRIRRFEATKRIENEKSTEAYEKIGKATELKNVRQFDESLKLFEESIKLFEEINWTNEVNKIKSIIEEVEREKERFLIELQESKEREQQELFNEKQRETQIIERANVEKLIRQQTQAEKLREQVIKKQEESEFQDEISDMINHAEKLAREYDVNMKKGVKKGKIVKKCIYPEVIKIYENVKEKVKEKGWKDQVIICENQIKLYKDLLEKDKKLREIESQKLQKQKDFEDSLKIKQVTTTSIGKEDQLTQFKEQRNREIEVRKFKEYIEKSLKEAEKLAREYDSNFKKAIKAGNLNFDSKYPEIIKVFTEARDRVLEKGWDEEAKIYSTHIRKYTELFDKEKRIREIETKKHEEEKIYEDFKKIKKESFDAEKLRQIEAQKIKEDEERQFQEEIDNLVNKAEKLARDYDNALKKALKEGKSIEESPYKEIIEIYSRIKDRFISKGWSDQVLIYASQIKIYQEKWENDKRLRELEREKIEKQKMYEKSLKVKGEREISHETVQDFENKQQKQLEDKKFQEEIAELVNKAEKLAREYELAMKKALKKGKFIEESPYKEIIEIYTRIKDRFISKGWNDQVLIYANQIKIYQEKWENDKKLRELEREKIEKQKMYEESLKVRGEREISHETVQDFENKQQKQLEDKKFQEEIAELVNKAEKLAREYELAMIKALKEGKFIEESPYIEVIEIYTKIRKLMLEKGWTEQGLVYTNQIKVYQEKLDKDKKLREIEDKKKHEQEAFVQAQKVLTTEDAIGFDVEKHKKIEELSKLEEEEEKFEREIDEEVDYAEKVAREYDLAIKKGEFERECPYLEIADIYKKIREKVYARGWRDEAEIYGSQVRLYQEKYEKDERLRELEAEKIKKQREFEASLKTIKDPKALRYQELEALSTKDREIEETTKQAMDLIDEAENAVRSYELSLKKDILGYKSPYEQVILNYENARKLFQKIGWNKEALKLKNTINFYKDKKIKDDNLREFEKQKLEESKQKIILAPKKEVFVKEERIIDFEKVKATESKESEAILNDIDRAEKLAQEYEIKKKDGILNTESPFEEIIKIYIKAKYDFKRIGWTNQAYQLENTIIYYKDKANADERLRVLEAEKIAKEEEQRKKQKIEAQLAKKAEEELLRLKAHELEIKRKTAIEYKSKESDAILNNIDRAEKLAQEYEIKKKDGILNVNSPFQEIIKIYEKAKLEFKRIGWTDQAYQLENTIHYYKDKAKIDENLRTLEVEKIAKEEQLRKKQKIEAQLAKDAEEELLRLKAHELEIKRKSAMEYESKKEQAFNFMDLAKKELKQNNFEKTVSYYKESEKIFAEIKWAEGIRMINESINAIKLKKEKIEREAQINEAKKLEKLKLEAQIQEQINKARDIQELEQEQRRKELLAIQEEKEREREISENAYRFIEEGTKLKDEKKFEEAYDKYMMGRDLFKKIEWEHEVSRINNDLLIILKKEMKQTEKLKAIQQKKIEEKKELEELLKEADEKQKELEIIRKEEKRKQREKIIQKERDIANDIIETLRYNEGVLALKKVIKKIENTDLDNLSRDMKKQIEELEKTSQVPIITNVELDRGENFDKFKIAFQALDNAQISLSNNVFMRAITELNEALFNLNETKIGQNFIPIIEEKINFYKKELDIKETPEKKIEVPKVESDDIRARIAARRAERKKKIKKLLGDDDYDDN